MRMVSINCRHNHSYRNRSRQRCCDCSGILYRPELMSGNDEAAEDACAAANGAATKASASTARSTAIESRCTATLTQRQPIDPSPGSSCRDWKTNARVCLHHSVRTIAAGFAEQLRSDLGPPKKTGCGNDSSSAPESKAWRRTCLHFWLRNAEPSRKVSISIGLIKCTRRGRRSGYLACQSIRST